MDAAMHLEVLKEATRVARRRVVLREDVYRNRFGKHLTFLLDRLANLDFGPHPHSNRTTPEWKYLLEAVGCYSDGSGEWVMWFLGLPFLHSVIVREIE